MLIELRVANHRSLRDEQVLTMEASRGGARDDERPRVVLGHKKRLLTVAALYGANASGKSNVLSALWFMREAVVKSYRLWPPEGGVPRSPFAWEGVAQEPSLFEVMLLLDGVRYQYGFVVDSERVLEEWLYAWPRGRKQVWFSRDGDRFEFGEHLSGENRLIEHITRANALFLSAAVQNRHEQLTILYRWFSNLQRFSMAEQGVGEEPERWWASRLFDEHPGVGESPSYGEHKHHQVDRGVFKALLVAADVGVLDFKAVSAEQRVGARRSHERILLKHQSADAEAWLPLSEESQGTRALFAIAPHLLDALHSGDVLLVDELESSLHPLLMAKVVALFNDPAVNVNHAQLVFTTHNTNLLYDADGNEPLRQDQVWLTSKDHQGATSLYPLSDYKLRASDNVERGYLQGRYGAVPYLGAFFRSGAHEQ